MSDMFKFSMSGGTLNRHEKQRTQKGFLAATLRDTSHTRLIIVKKNGSAVAVVPRGESQPPQWHHALPAVSVKDSAALIYLGQEPTTAEHFFATTPENVSSDSIAHVKWHATKGPLQSSLPAAELSTLGLALSLVQWHAKNAFCSKCGSPSSGAGDLGFSRRCTKCRAQNFPQIMPAMLVAVFDGKGNVVLSQRRKKSNVMTILSGFMVLGESAEETVSREVEEEAGVAVRSMRYIGSQPFPFPYLVMLCYYAVAEAAPLRADEDELIKVCWVSKDEVARAIAGTHPDMAIPGPWTAAYQMLKPWVDGLVDDCGRPTHHSVNSHL